MSDTETRDVIVIGAGLAGLTAAATLARAGRNVLVLEQHAVPGGYAHEFRRGRFCFEVSLHSIDGVAPGGMVHGILSELGVLRRVSFVRLDPFYVARFSGTEITAHADAARYEEELAQEFPGERKGIRSLFAELASVHREVRNVLIGATRSPRDLGTRAPGVVRAMTETWGAFLDRHVRDPKLRAAVSAPWSYHGLPPSRLCAAQFAIPWGSYHLCGAFYPHGGSMAMSRALEAAIRESGGEVAYREKAERIVVENGRAVAVRTASGREIRTRLVVSNASVPDTMLGLLGREHVPTSTVRRLERIPPSLSSFIVYLGLDRDLASEPSIPHELFLQETEGDPEEQYRAALSGDWSRAQIVVASYGRANPRCAPPGKSVLVIMTLAPWDHQDVWGTRGELAGYRENPRYREQKRRVADALLERVERQIPGLRASIVEQEVATPLTNFRYSLNPRGAIYGFEQSLEGAQVRRPGPRTALPNVFVAGSWSAPGGGQSAAIVSGRAAAMLALSSIE